MSVKIALWLRTSSHSSASGDSAAIRRRQEQKQAAYTRPDAEDAPPEDEYGYFGDPAHEHPLAYDDDDPHAPIYYDGYTPDPGDQGALTDEEFAQKKAEMLSKL